MAEVSFKLVSDVLKIYKSRKFKTTNPLYIPTICSFHKVALCGTREMNKSQIKIETHV